MTMTKHKKDLLQLIALGFLTSASPVWAKKDPDISLDGYLGTKFEAESFKNGEISHRIELDLETERVKGLKAEASLRYESLNEEVLFREAVVNKKFDAGWRLEFGYGKKRFGREFEQNKLERSTIERSPVAKRLQVFTYAGRETILRYYRKANAAKDRSGVELAIGYSEAENSSLLVSQSFGLTDRQQLSYWLQLQSDHTDTGSQLVASAITSYQYGFDGLILITDLVVGIDPDQTELNKELDIGGVAYFAAIKVETLFDIAKDEDAAWQLVLQSSYFGQDLDAPRFNTIQALAGGRYQTGPVSLALNLEGLGSTSRVDPTNRNFSESQFRFEVLYEY